jgi:VWFA-related protein
MSRLWLVRALICVVIPASLAVAAQEVPDAPTPKTTPPPNQFPAGTAPAPKNPHPEPNAAPEEQQTPPPSHPVETVQPTQRQPGELATSRNDLPRIVVNVSFVQVPVTVKDSSGRLVPGLTSNDFTIYEDGVPQRLSFFNSDAFPLSAAIVLDTALPSKTLQKVNETLPALIGAFSQFDEVGLFRYGNTVQEVSAFAGANNVSTATLGRLKRTGRNEGPPVLGGPMGPQGPMINGQPVDPGTPRVYNPPSESYVLNDAVLRAAQELSKRDKVRRRIILIISDGREYGSAANYEEVRKVLLSHNISVYALGVDTAAIPIYDKANRIRLPGFGTGNILPKYVSDTGGEAFAEFSKDSIEQAYARITEVARNQYTLGYNAKGTLSSSYRSIDVHVHRPDLVVTAKPGYYPLPPVRH